jgi:uncharacterized protein (TIGR02186 family)
MRLVAAAFVVGACCLASAAKAERLVASLSNHRVAITSNFAGEDLVLFGAIEPDAATGQAGKYYDVVVTVVGPRQTFRTRRKARMLGIWVNVDSREFVRVPSYLSVLSNRPFKLIAGTDTLRKLQIGLDNFLLTQRIGPDTADTVREDPFRVAFVSLETDAALYTENVDAVTFLTPTVFRAAIPLPARVPIGNYDIDVKLVANGEQVGRTTATLEIIKAGFEEYVAEAARSYGFVYGLATVALALLTGWFASVVLRRD